MKNTEPPSGLRRGVFVRVRSREEILATLDERGRVDLLPFMPEMLEHCGKSFRVESRAHKTCDTIAKTGGRRMKDAVHLEGLRCSGASHGGCQAGCLVFFKNVWLERVDAGATGNGAVPATPIGSGAKLAPPRCTEATLQAETRSPPNPSGPGDSEVVYSCQITELFRATTPLKWWDVRQYFEDVTSGNVAPGDMLNRLFSRFTANATLHLPGYRFWIELNARVQRMLGRAPYPIIQGKLKRTPSESLNLQPGEEVEVKSLEEIVATLDVRNRNRGMAFDKEQAPYCGQRHVVHSRVTRIIDEPTGKMMELPNDCIVLKDVACRSCYSEKRIGCPRAIYSYWRECWLKRVASERT